MRLIHFATTALLDFSKLNHQSPGHNTLSAQKRDEILNCFIMGRFGEFKKLCMAFSVLFTAATLFFFFRSLLQVL